MKQALREHLLQTCSEHELARWFDPLSLSLDGDGRSLEVGFPHAYFARWFEGGIRDRFEALLAAFLGDGCSVRYRESKPSNGSARPEPPAQARNIDCPFDSQFTFDTFLVNKKNYFPLASAREVAKQAGTLFNPFVLCGAGGSGKSHLLRAIANEISKRQDPARILLTSMQGLQALYSRTKDPLQARAGVLDHDFLFVDDFQQIRAMPELQQELVSIFNHFYDNRKQMVFSSPTTIASCEFLDPMLRSRLEWGLIVTLKQPDLEVRVSYVQNRCRTKKLMLSKEQMLTLAQRFQDFRYLQGILLKLTAFRELVRKELDDKDFEHILNNTEEKTAEALAPGTVIAIVAEHLGVSPKDIVGSRRNQNIAQARQVAMFLCRDLLGLSFPALGRAFGGKDHSTVLYSVKKIEQMQADDQSLKKVLKELKKKCLFSGEQGARA